MGKRRSGQKLCVVSSCSTDNDDIYKIFIVDIGGGGRGEVYLETEPNIRIQAFDGHRRMSFCFLDSVLYVFDNFNKFDLSESRYQKKSVYKYAFDPDEVCKKKNFLLELTTLGVFSRMLTAKVDGRAIPIPDGRILVHSCEIDIPIKDGQIFEDDNEEDLKHFEIFDPKTGLSVELQAPELRVGYMDLELHTDDKGWISMPRNEPLMGDYKDEIDVSAVVNSIMICRRTLVLSVQIIQLSTVHFLTIDIECPTARGWQPYHGWLLPRAHVQHYDPDPGPSLVVEDRVCFTCRLGYANGNESAAQVEHPLSDITSIPVQFHGAPSCIALVDYLPNQECWFAVVRTRFTIRMGEYIAIDVFKGELPSKKKKKKKEGVVPTPRVQRIKTFKFHIPVEDGCFCVRNAFMLCPTIFPFPVL